MAKKELYDIAVEKKHETERAWLLTDGTKTDWFPKSQCELEETPSGLTLTAPVWLLKEKGFL